jgi:hypothetical protein
MLVEIPKFLRHLPTFRGYPIPFVQLIGPDGTPDFKVLDHPKLLDCIKRRACSICGHPMRGTYCFIGGEKSINLRMFTDGPMHNECARFCAKTCPYLARADRGHAVHDSKFEGKVALTASAAIDRHAIPTRMGMLYTKSYSYKQGNDGLIYFTAGEPTSIDWTAMPESECPHAR